MSFDQISYSMKQKEIFQWDQLYCDFGCIKTLSDHREEDGSLSLSPYHSNQLLTSTKEEAEHRQCILSQANFLLHRRNIQVSSGMVLTWTKWKPIKLNQMQIHARLQSCAHELVNRE